LKLSTAIAVTYFTDNILDNLDKGSIAGAVFLDLSKAFDTVSHDRLIQKLGTIGFSQPTINWFSSYLSNRFQVTSIQWRSQRRVSGHANERRRRETS
jgi:hypothetical protein